VAVSNSDVIIGIFHRHNPSSPIMVLKSTEPLTEKSTRTSSEGVKVAGA